MTASSRPLRADAERNRRAIVRAAAAIFAKEGTEVTLEHVAQAAGVGVGTIYRRFSSIQELVEVVLEDKMTRYADRSEAAAEHALVQPWEAFRDYVMFLLEEQARDLAFSDVILAMGSGTDLFLAERSRAFRASVRLVVRARNAGAIRADFDHSDLYLLQNANAGVLRAPLGPAALAWKRFGEYMLQAFRGREPRLTPPPAAWSDPPTVSAP